MNKGPINNNTQKCDKCLTCGAYMYGCGGVKDKGVAEKCKEYKEDQFAYIRQDRDETYVKPESIINEEINKAIKNHNQYKTKIYFFAYDRDETISIAYSCAVPNIGEKVIIHEEGVFTKYEVMDRAMGVNQDTNSAVWNVYIKEV